VLDDRPAGHLSADTGRPARHGRRRSRAWAALILAAACFGLDTTLSSFALRELRPADLFVVETFVGSAVLWGFLLAGRRLRRPRRIGPLLVLGLVEPGIAYLLFDLGLPRTSAVSAGLLVSTETLFSVALAVAFLRERLAVSGWLSLAAGAAGTALVSVSSGGGGATLGGDLLVLAASAVAASYFLVARRLPADGDALSGTAYQLLAACAVALVFAAVSWPTQGTALPSASAATLAVAVSTGIVGITIPFYLVNRALQSTSGSITALILNLVPVFAVGTAVALLGEAVMVTTILGGGLILAGLVVLARTEGEEPSPAG
jgi:drug/metabolite transporter (DMT)-like permease